MDYHSASYDVAETVQLDDLVGDVERGDTLSVGLDVTEVTDMSVVNVLGRGTVGDVVR